MRHKRRILGIEEAGLKSIRPAVMTLKAPTFWGSLGEFLSPKYHNTFNQSQIELSILESRAGVISGRFRSVCRSFESIFKKIQIINTLLKYGLTKLFEMIKLIK